MQGGSPEAVDTFRVPAGVDGAQALEFQEQRQPLEPARPVPPLSVVPRKGGQGGRVLERLAGAMGAEVAAVAVRGVVTDGVVLRGCP